MKKLLSYIGKAIKEHKLRSGVLAVVIIASLLGIQIKQSPYPQTNSNFVIGQQQVVITIGTPLSAAGVADYTADGIADNIQFQAALNALPTNGGKLVILAGDYNFSATVSRAINDVTIQGIGNSTYFAYNGASAIFSAGSQSNWVFRDFSTDAGG